MFNKKAFTLTELLVALGIVGAVAILSIPSLVNNINNKILVSQLKNTITIIQQLALEQLVQNNTHDLRDTDFKSAGTLLSSGNFEVGRPCGNAAVDCWKTSAEESKKIEYRKISTKETTGISGPTYTSVVLKNGVLLGYTTTDIDYGDDDKLIGEFCVDVNGNDAPNMPGRDYFCFYISKSAQIVAQKDIEDTEDDETDDNTKCINGVEANFCTKSIIESNWKMTY